MEGACTEIVIHFKIRHKLLSSMNKLGHTALELNLFPLAKDNNCSVFWLEL